MIRLRFLRFLARLLRVSPLSLLPDRRGMNVAPISGRERHRRYRLAKYLARKGIFTHV
jgi:hypothetical protein